jgi:hypothetical protein
MKNQRNYSINGNLNSKLKSIYHYVQNGLFFCSILLITTFVFASSGELPIDNFEVLSGWKVRGIDDLTVKLSKKYVKQGKKSLLFHVGVDHKHNNDRNTIKPSLYKNFEADNNIYYSARKNENLIGWASLINNYHFNVSLNSYDFLEFDIFFEGINGIDPDFSINLMLKDRNDETLYRTTLINLRNGRWAKQKLSIRDIPGLEDFVRLHFFVSESDYNHGDSLNFYIDHLRATKELIENSSIVSPLEENNMASFNENSTANLIYNTDGLMIWTEGSCRKIYRNNVENFSKKLENASLELSAAQNETEAGQIILFPKKKGGVGNVYLEIEHLIGPNGSKISSSNISWSPVYYVPATEGPPEGLPDGLPGPIPFLADKEFNYPIWIEVYVPLGSPSGDYKAPITIHTSLGLHKIELKLHVWGFAIPIVQNLRTSTTIYGNFGWSEEIIKWFGGMPYDHFVNKWKPKIIAMLAKYRLSARNNYHLPLKYDQKKNKVFLGDTTRFEYAISSAIKRGQRLNDMGVAYYYDRDTFLGEKKGTEEYLKRIFDAYRVSAEFLKKKGWLKESYVYCVDEVLEHKLHYFGKMDYLNKVFESIRNAHHGIKLFGTEVPSPKISDMDIWCINMKSFNIDVLNEQHLLGKDVWWYNGYSSPKPGMGIASRAVEHRSLFWMNFKYGIDGYYIWTVNRWINNPWKNPNRKERWAAGNHFLLYPNPDGTVSPSLRISMLRDGLEDYEYHHLLNEAAKKLKKNGKIVLANECEDILKKADYFITSYDNCSNIQPKHIYDSRKILANQIVKVMPHLNY